MIAPGQMPVFALYGAVAALLSLTESQSIAQATDTASQLQIDEQGISLFVQQPASTSMPGSNGSIVISIGDITGGMVLVSLNDKEPATSRRTPATVLRETPMVVGELVEFEVKDEAYGIVLARLNDVLVGDDTAEFKIVRHDDVADQMKETDAGKQSNPREIQVGEWIETNVSGTLELRGITRAGSVRMRLNGSLFSVQPAHWVWLTGDEILEISSAFAERGAVTIELYHPSPSPRPF